MTNIKPYPKHQARETGMKVGWLGYNDEATARAAGEIASHNARILAGQGYDFGYQEPGYVIGPTHPNNRFKTPGLWEVCIP